MEIDPFLIQPKKNEKLGGKYKLSWVEDSLTIGSARQDEDMVGSGTSHIGSSITSKKIFAILLTITLALTIILGRLLYLQVLQGDEYYARAEGNRQRIIPIPSERGLIFDRNGIQLTQNIPNFSLAVIPQDLPRDDRGLNLIISQLSEITSHETQDIKDTIEKYRYYKRDSIVIEEDIPYDTALKILIASADLPGIHIQRGSKRLYDPDGIVITSTTLDNIVPETSYNALSHVLGYVGKLSPEELDIYYEKGYLPSDSIGKIGVEKTYEEYLRGIYGRKRIEVDARGKEQAILAEEAPYPGSHLTLSIDIQMQSKLEEIMKRRMQEEGTSRASAIAMNPQNGEVLALVSLPGFDNNDFSGGIESEKYTNYIQDEDRPLFNRAIGGTYPSGSVIKPAIASAALQEGIINATTSFLSTGGISVGAWFFPDWKTGGHGRTNVRKSIAWSVNTFYYYIGGGYGDFVGLGVSRITDYLRKYGFSNKLGIDIPAEADGFLPSPEWKKKVKDEPWYQGDTYNLSIGQGDFLTTPLQIAAMTATISNGGTLYQPHIVKEVYDEVTHDTIPIDPVVLNSNFIAPSHIQTIKGGMNDCVHDGSCWALRNLPFESGGKTGTAQWNSNRNTHAWFTSFAPLDYPEIVVTVMVEEGGEGSLAAEPIAGEFYKWWANYR